MLLPFSSQQRFDFNFMLISLLTTSSGPLTMSNLASFRLDSPLGLNNSDRRVCSAKQEKTRKNISSAQYFSLTRFFFLSFSLFFYFLMLPMSVSVPFSSNGELSIPFQFPSYCSISILIAFYIITHCLFSYRLCSVTCL